MGSGNSHPGTPGEGESSERFRVGIDLRLYPVLGLQRFSKLENQAALALVLARALRALA